MQILLELGLAGREDSLAWMLIFVTTYKLKNFRPIRIEPATFWFTVGYSTNQQLGATKILASVIQSEPQLDFAYKRYLIIFSVIWFFVHQKLNFLGVIWFFWIGLQ